MIPFDLLLCCVQPTAHEWAVIGAAVTAILRLGPFALSPEGLCLILEAITLRAICEVSFQMNT